MKNYIFTTITAIALVLSINSCSLDLDINDNPNAPTGAVVTPDLTLTAIIAGTASDNFGTFDLGPANWTLGYECPGSGIAGYGSDYTYSYTAASFTGCWTNTFARLRDYVGMISQAEADPQWALYGGICHIMKAFSFNLLVDAYGDVPYNEGVTAYTTGIVTPAYDDDAAVYQLIVKELDDAIATLRENKGLIGATVKGLTKATDPVFSGDIDKWIKFANNIKLRLLVRALGTEIDGFAKSAFSTFSSEGFLKEDVLVNPGYNTSQSQNPLWGSYHSGLTGTVTTRANYYIPTEFIYSYYDGEKLLDTIRGKLVYKSYPNTPLGVLGAEGNPESNLIGDYCLYTGTGTGTAASTASGLCKSRTAGLGLFFAADLYFLLAEAALKGYAIDGDARTNYVNGVTASFNYLSWVGTATAPPSGFNPATHAQNYFDANKGNRLADYDAATNDEERLETIITQRYIAANMLFCYQAWIDFRRTGYPTVDKGRGSKYDFYSVQASNRADYPRRLIYPESESTLNKNTPEVKSLSDKPIFWDQGKVTQYN